MICRRFSRGAPSGVFGLFKRGRVPVAEGAPSATHSTSTGRLAAIAVAIIAVGMLSLFVHDLALSHLNVPYPREAPIPRTVRGVELMLIVGGMVWFSCLARLRLAGLSALAGAALTAVLVAALNEFLRIVIITTTLANHGWSHAYYVLAIATYGPKIAAQAALAFCAALVVHRTDRLRDYLLTTVILAGLGAFVVIPGAVRASGWLTGHLAAFDADNRYNPPYPPGIYAVIYATYIEPTLAAFAMAGLAWPGLRGSLLQRAATFCLVLLLVHGRIGQFLIESFWVKVDLLPLRFAATGQFLLETIVLGLACPLLWGTLVARNHRS